MELLQGTLDLLILRTLLLGPAHGHAIAKAMTSKWEKLAGAIARILRPAE
jgi:PadR family transcriptional regulator, regulatory protein PadR